MSKSTTIVAGVDVSKGRLDVEIAGSAVCTSASNDSKGHAELIKWFTSHGVTRIGMEASGGYERAPVEAFRKAGFEVALLQPRQVRAYATYRLKRAKNDRIDAALIARCTAELDCMRVPRDSRLAAMDEHLRLIEQVEVDHARMKTRREAYRTRRLQGWIDREIARLGRRLEAERALLVKEIFKHEDLVRRLQLIESVEGVGRRTACTLLILMPELGRLTREEAASLAGLAPFDDDTGKRRGERHIAGGRFRVRRALYNAALAANFRWNPRLIALYQRLTAIGRKHKQALIACTRKLLIFVNTVLARGSRWQKQAPVR
jgi:transposase